MIVFQWKSLTLTSGQYCNVIEFTFHLPTYPNARSKKICSFTFYALAVFIWEVSGEPTILFWSISSHQIILLDS